MVQLLLRRPGWGAFRTAPMWEYIRRRTLLTPSDEAGTYYIHILIASCECQLHSGDRMSLRVRTDLLRTECSCFHFSR